eukprot:NODE_1386_length_1355_cov_118.916938_g1374_i0.p1 GENE.NODE_1386_length_1355_cov_118.916938_g1374_i0~~NODE_1386_length_1355_cov_118.916938_g1374_i0.p1  ORF type:complete len:291 (-),score=18.25 NODE_1386_length_1355_cov_118.916938_g1374_i0:4-876(-)
MECDDEDNEIKPQQQQQNPTAFVEALHSATKQEVRRERVEVRHQVAKTRNLILVSWRTRSRITAPRTFCRSTRSRWTNKEACRNTLHFITAPTKLHRETARNWWGVVKSALWRSLWPFWRKACGLSAWISQASPEPRMWSRHAHLDGKRVGCANTDMQTEDLQLAVNEMLHPAALHYTARQHCLHSWTLKGYETFSAPVDGGLTAHAVRRSSATYPLDMGWKREIWTNTNVLREHYDARQIGGAVDWGDNDDDMYGTDEAAGQKRTVSEVACNVTMTLPKKKKKKKKTLR